ncbi:Acg family FMN-binding oxidoreductase [Streptomyces fragilis]|uniref:Nitroreductase n=1 Tax=Streptomyces fragilis TaxID=67301 RepID=A0ABV2YGL8_9ACTN|nr:nitroreductase [Streptomyces fragilis]
MPTPHISPPTVRDLVHAAATAPSLHNAQPWRFVYHRGTGVLDLRADPARGMPYADPDHRAQFISCGAALFNLRVAAAHSGLVMHVSLLPEPEDPWLVARVRPGTAGGAAATGALASLRPALARRHTSRVPFEDHPLPDAVRQLLIREAEAEGARLLFPGGWHVRFLVDLIAEAEHHAEHAGDPDEARWLRVGTAPELAPDGVPWSAVGPQSQDAAWYSRDFGHGTGREQARVRFERHPQLAILSTADDDPPRWVLAGQALERVLLAATTVQVATGLTTQPLERQSLRWLLRDPVHGHGAVQMILRLGYGPTGAVTRRRPVDDILDLEP